MKQKKEEVRKELEDLSPFLSKLKKENPFEVPYGYFDKMQREVMDKALGEKTASRATPLSWWDQLVASFAFMLRPQVAMGIIGIALVAWVVIFTFRSEEATPALAQDDSFVTDANAYLAANIDDLDDEMLLLLVATDENNIPNTSVQETLEEDQMIDEILDELDGLDIEDLL